MHNINKMVYVGAEPWHGLGVKLPRNATYQEISELAGFYDVAELPVLVPPLHDPVPDKKALVRRDDYRLLGIVNSTYRVVQFSEVAKTLVEAAGMVGGFFHTAGTLGPVGRRGWMLGELPGEIVVRGDPSPIKKYLLGTTGHDGVSAITLKNVATRVVCANTLGLALGEEGGAEFKILHTANAGIRLQEAATAMRRLLVSYDRFGDLANLMAVTRFTEAQLMTTLDNVMPVPQDDKNHDRIIRDREKVKELFETGIGIEGQIRGTAWATFQAFTEWADHHSPIRASTGQDARHVRLESIWLGRLAQVKEAALAAIMQASQVSMAWA
jgi:phage/plasmid-like protein (TIGR03299 family)